MITECRYGYAGALCGACLQNEKEQFYNFDGYCLECPSLIKSFGSNFGFMLILLAFVLITLKYK